MSEERTIHIRCTPDYHYSAASDTMRLTVPDVVAYGWWLESELGAIRRLAERAREAALSTAGIFASQG